MRQGTYAPRPVGEPLTKPARGTKQLADRQRTAGRQAAERKAMNVARKRDRGCRWAGCDCKAKKLRVDVAHQIHRGMGGNPSLDKTQPRLLISLCLVRHGQWDRGEIDIRPQDEARGFDWCADFYRRNEAGGFDLVASERVIGVSVARS